MDPATIATIVSWFAQPAAQALFTIAQTAVQQRLGLSSSSDPASQGEPLLEKYLQKLIARLDEDRIAKLYGAFSKLRDASKSVTRQSLLSLALDGFHEIARIPEQGMTGNQPNAELRCMAFVGMVASYTLLHDRRELIEEKMIEAVSADAVIASQWLGEEIVREILVRLPAPTISCPHCGFQNPAGSKFCNQDGYPLKPDQNALLSQESTLTVIRPQALSAGARLFRMILDGNEIGVLRNGEIFRSGIDGGRHTLFLRIGSSSTPPLTFDVAAHEEVRVYCQIETQQGTPYLWKKPSSQTPLVHVRARDSFFGDSATFQIMLDGNEVGAVRSGNAVTFVAQAGQHTLFLHRISFSTPPLIFAIALSEEITFCCKALAFKPYLKLWRSENAEAI